MKSVIVDGMASKIRVVMDITKPIRCGILTIMGYKKLTLEVRYEKLPDFCYRCGMLTHVEIGEGFYGRT